MPVAEHILRPRLKAKPTDVAAIRMMAELAARLGRYADAENLLRRALELAPAFAPRAPISPPCSTSRTGRPRRSPSSTGSRATSGDDAGHQNLKAAALGRIGSYEEAIGLYEQVLARQPGQPKVWMSYGHVLKTVGRQDGQHRRLSPRDRRSRRRSARSGGASPISRRSRFDDARRRGDGRGARRAGPRPTRTASTSISRSARRSRTAARPRPRFGHYAEGNRLRRAVIDYDPAEISAHVRRSDRLVHRRTSSRPRAGQGCPAPDPIFILGMPRAGSTLVEQILASHRQVEGTMELPDIPALAKRLGGAQAARPTPRPIPNASPTWTPARLRALGEEYLERTRIQRKTDRPFFIDKMPNNWAHVGLIRLILPNAKIVDARRHPLACCFSNFKQHFARGQGFTYDLAEIGRYYRDYVALMAPFRRGPAGPRPPRHPRARWSRIRKPRSARLLDFLGLAFDPACLALPRE